MLGHNRQNLHPPGKKKKRTGGGGRNYFPQMLFSLPFLLVLQAIASSSTGSTVNSSRRRGGGKGRRSSIAFRSTHIAEPPYLFRRQSQGKRVCSRQLLFNHWCHWCSISSSLVAVDSILLPCKTFRLPVGGKHTVLFPLPPLPPDRLRDKLALSGKENTHGVRPKPKSNTRNPQPNLPKLHTFLSNMFT